MTAALFSPHGAAQISLPFLVKDGGTCGPGSATIRTYGARAAAKTDAIASSLRA